jgi:hypothetical protein
MRRRRSRKDWRKDAARGAEGRKGGPEGKRKHLAEGGGANGGGRRGVTKVEGSEETNGSVKKLDAIGPGDVVRGVGTGGRGKENTRSKVKDTVGAGCIAMPEWPEATSGIRKRSIVRMFSKEVAVVEAGVDVIRAGRVRRALGKINLNKVPARAKGACRSVRDKEEAVDRFGYSREEGGSGCRSRSNRGGVIGGNNGNGGGSGDRGNGWRRSRGTVVDFDGIGKIKGCRHSG